MVTVGSYFTRFGCWYRSTVSYLLMFIDLPSCSYKMRKFLYMKGAIQLCDQVWLDPDLRHCPRAPLPLSPLSAYQSSYYCHLTADCYLTTVAVSLSPHCHLTTAPYLQCIFTNVASPLSYHCCRLTTVPPLTIITLPLSPHHCHRIALALLPYQYHLTAVTTVATLSPLKFLA